MYANLIGADIRHLSFDELKKKLSKVKKNQKVSIEFMRGLDPAQRNTIKVFTYYDILQMGNLLAIVLFLR